jgi:hypothetical protein
MSLFSNEKMDTSGGVIQTIEPASMFINAATVTQVIFACPAGQSYVVSEVRSLFSTASTSGVAKLEVLTGTQASGAGAQITGNITLFGTANVLTVTPPTAQAVMTAGSRLNVQIGGTMTGLVGGFLQVTLKRIS